MCKPIKPVGTKIHIFYMCHMKGHEANITFNQKTWHWAYLVFMLFALTKTTKKLIFSTMIFK